MKRIFVWFFVVLAAMVSLDGFAANSVFTWNGGASGNWNDAANWLCDGGATDRWPGKDCVDQNNTDEVQLDGVTAEIILTSAAYVKVFKLLNNADITIASESTKYRLYVYGGGMSIVDSCLTFDNADLLHSTGVNQWGCGKALVFNGDSVLTLRKCTMYNGRVDADKCYVVRCYEGSTFWYRYDTELPAFDYLFDNSTYNGYGSDSRLHAAGDSKITFAGTTPKMTVHTKPTQVNGNLTLRYVLPESPYANPPVQSESAVDFENTSGTVAIEIDPESPGLTSGTMQKYRLIKCDKDASVNGIVLDNFILPTLRTADEVFVSDWKSGSAAPIPPQYLDVWIDGTYDPDNVAMEAEFDEPASFRPNMRFAGKISAMGVVGGAPATRVTVKLEYGATDSLGTEVTLGEVTEAGDFSFDFDGFDATSTYYYRLSLVNDLEQSVVSEIGTCSHICGTQLGSEISATMVDGRGTVSGSVYVLGAGTTTVRLLFGRNELEMFEAASFTVDALGPFSVDVIYPNEGKWYYKFVSENAYGQQHWEWESRVSFLEVSDSNTYTWKGGDGDLYDKTKWTCAMENSGIGFPTSASSIVFPSNTTAVIQYTNSVNYVNVKFLQDDSDYTFVGNGATFGMTKSSSGGKNAKLTLDNVKFADPVYIWSGSATMSVGDGGSIDLLNGAQAVYKYFNLNGDDSTVFVGDGARLEFALGGFSKPGSGAVISNGYMIISNPITMNGAKVTLLGESPRMSVTRNTCEGVDFFIELPEAPYATVPIASGADTGTFANDKITTINILNSPAARREGGTYRILKWGLINDSSKTAYGVNTNNVVISGLGEGDGYTWSWEPGEAYQSLGPQYLDIHYAKRSAAGLTILFR